MSGRHYFGVMALLASTALSQVPLALAQETQPAEEQGEEDALVQQTVIVRGEFIPDEKRSTSEVSSVLDADDFAIQGDGDIAAALRRVTGVSIADNKFVIVRGLNERYSSSTLNGSPLPSPEPLRRVAPLDLFPTSVLQSTLVQKTYSPEQSAEFGGGSIDIRTKAVPEEAFFEISGSLGANTETTFQDGFLYNGSDTDFLGYDDGVRDLPPGLGALINGQTTDEFGNVLEIEDLPTAENRAIALGLFTDPNLVVLQEGQVGPDVGIDLAAGNRYDVNADLSIGVLGTVSYGNEWQTREARRGFAFFGDSERSSLDSNNQDFTATSTTNTTTINALGSVGLDLFTDHEIQFTGFVTRGSEKEARIEQGNLDAELERDQIQRQDVTEWIERELWTTQARGDHVFPSLMDLEVGWRASYSEATREAPYQLSVGFDVGDNGPTISGETNLTNIEFSTIEDEATDLGIDLLLPLLVGDIEVDIKGGYAYVEKDRSALSNQFVLAGATIDPAVRSLRPDVAFSQVFDVENGSATLQDLQSASFPSFYLATLEVDAFYAGIDAQLTPFLRAAVGGRYEDAIEVVQTRETPTSDFPGVEGSDGGRLNAPPIDEAEFYPAATLTWNFADNLQVRVGYSETITRPQFRELAPSRFVNSETDQAFFGNPFLVNSNLTNYDARVEYYFQRDQFITAGFFYKDIENPIEEINSGDESGTVTFINVPSAELRGLELEYQQTLPLQDWGLDFGWLSTKDVTIKTNYTYTDSEIGSSGSILLFNRGGAQNGVLTPRVIDDASGFIEDGRQLQGQSEHLLNFQLGYADFEARSEANFLINFASERIRTGESFNNPDAPAVIEEPPVSVDFVYNREFTLYGGEYEAGFQVQNLFGDEYTAFQEAGSDTLDVDTYDIGTSFSVSLKRTF
ncbi:MAG: TonB-dependent receptor [Pseudomonadota bacterium]